MPRRNHRLSVLLVNPAVSKSQLGVPDGESTVALNAVSGGSQGDLCIAEVLRRAAFGLGLSSQHSTELSDIDPQESPIVVAVIEDLGVWALRIHGQAKALHDEGLVISPHAHLSCYLIIRLASVEQILAQGSHHRVGVGTVAILGGILVQEEGFLLFKAGCQVREGEAQQLLHHPVVRPLSFDVTEERDLVDRGIRCELHVGDSVGSGIPLDVILDG